MMKGKNRTLGGVGGSKVVKNRRTPLTNDPLGQVSCFSKLEEFRGHQFLTNGT